jgi:hypothetical protein
VVKAVLAGTSPDAQRIGRPPRDCALGVEALEISEQQHAKIAIRQQPWTPDLVGVEAVTE